MDDFDRPIRDIVKRIIAQQIYSGNISWDSVAPGMSPEISLKRKE